jgi:hypothetical protein
MWTTPGSGFQVRCNLIVRIELQMLLPVSIPIGFSGSLQLEQAFDELAKIEVSIPIGFSGSLQRVSMSSAWYHH